MHKQKTCGCGGRVHGKQGCGCHGRKHLTKEEKKAYLVHKQECLEKELQGIKEALDEL